VAISWACRKRIGRCRLLYLHAISLDLVDKIILYYTTLENAVITSSKPMLKHTAKNHVSAVIVIVSSSSSLSLSHHHCHCRVIIIIIVLSLLCYCCCCCLLSQSQSLSHCPCHHCHIVPVIVVPVALSLLSSLSQKGLSWQIHWTCLGQENCKDIMGFYISHSDLMVASRWRYLTYLTKQEG